MHKLRFVDLFLFDPLLFLSLSLSPFFFSFHSEEIEERQTAQLHQRTQKEEEKLSPSLEISKNKTARSSLSYHHIQ